MLTRIANPANSHTALPVLEMVAAAPALPTSIGLLLPSISSLHDEDVVHRPDLFLELADRVARAVTDLDALETPTEPAEVVGFLAVFAERRGFGLPDPTALAMDARVVAGEIPADLFPLACARLWARFRYRRLPEPPDFAMAVQEEIDERRAAAARIRTVALKIRTAQMFARFEAEAADRHARRKQEERARRIHADATSGCKESRRDDPSAISEDQPACVEPRGRLAAPTFMNTVDADVVAGRSRPDPSAREEAGANAADTVFGASPMPGRALPYRPRDWALNDAGTKAVPVALDPRVEDPGAGEPRLDDNHKTGRRGCVAPALQGAAGDGIEPWRVSASISTSLLATIDGRSPPRPPDEAVETLPSTCLDAIKDRVSECPSDWAALPLFVACLLGCGTYPRIEAPIRASPSENIDRYPIHVVPLSSRHLTVNGGM